ncbi:MAG: hypothetical protein M0Q13_03490 [Methanothrix sp.]|jgi:hypothetical protein|nr:hypothetical protein [Methanothrix sp.]
MQSKALRFAHNSSKRSGLLFYPTISTSRQLSAIMKRKQLRKRASISEFEIESARLNSCRLSLETYYEIELPDELAISFI